MRKTQGDIFVEMDDTFEIKNHKQALTPNLDYHYEN
jgi:hypothetical protein